MNISTLAGGPVIAGGELGKKFFYIEYINIYKEQCSERLSGQIV